MKGAARTKAESKQVCELEQCNRKTWTYVEQSCAYSRCVCVSVFDMGSHTENDRNSSDNENDVTLSLCHLLHFPPLSP